ncbi:hypothetical protein OQA88_8049 [Cercophora sp. LCS_1]
MHTTQAGQSRRGGRGGRFTSPAKPQATHREFPKATAYQNGTASQPQPSGQGKLREWKRLLEHGSQISRPSPAALSRFFQVGLELMDGDVGAAQEVIKLFASDTGLSFIKDITDRNILQQASVTDATIWMTQIRPMFQLVTHPLVVNSSVLEQQVAILFNYIYGVGGDRMTRLFNHVTKTVQSWPSGGSEPSRTAAVELSLCVLSKVLDCNTANIINEKFATLVSGLSKCLTAQSRPEDEFSHLQALRYLEYIRLRLNVGDEIEALRNTINAPVSREKFTLRRDLPGTLSAEGRRHDNDHACITDIKILPTYEEIISPRAEYLPTTEPSQWHVQGICGRLDREFRLLREDTVGQLRDAVRDTLESIRAHQNLTARQPNNGARTYSYSFPTPIDVEIDRDGRLELVVRCNQLDNVRQLNSQRRRDWWMQSKRLQSGALICVLDATGSVLFCVVSDSTMRTSDDRRDRWQRKDNKANGPDAPKLLTLSEDQDSLFLRLLLVDPGKRELKQALSWYQNVGSSPNRYLVEFPGVLLASFKDTLEALQQIYRQPNVPFSNLLAPPQVSSVNSTGGSKIPLPQYARQAGFSYGLSCLGGPIADFSINPQTPPDPQVIASQSTLDSTQSAALLNTLCRGLSLIQGPPGTGKSYTGEKIIKVLLENKRKAKLGPILCVCYTNHALDQLLEHLLDDQINSVIRIGSRSKSERLQDLNLRTVVQSFDRTKTEKRSLWDLDQSIRESVNEMKGCVEELSVVNSQRSIKLFLETNFPWHHQELFGKTEKDDGWETVDYHQDQLVDRWLRQGPVVQSRSRSVNDLTAAPLATMSFDERRLLHRHWLRSIRDKIIGEIVQIHRELDEAIDKRDRMRRDVDLRCLQQADIVGVTTTGLARNLHLLRKLQCKVMLCEEAGEVLEAHLLTALLPSVEHAILIGDHLQLRPQIQNYDLQSTNPRGRQYSLDMSLFERLVEPPHDTDIRLPFSMLETQRRMHPSIAELVRSTLYPSLRDADNVSKYPIVVGMRKRLFWLHHSHPEVGAASHDPLNTSHSNDFEVEMTAALVSHLVRQGEYSRSDIAVITPYLGQLQRLRRRMESMFEICLNDRDQEQVEALEADGPGVPPPTLRTQLGKTTLARSIRIATVDNFQGEEAKVVVISLVRSNPQNNCGFLRTSNRINVLLSRAQHGMYVIGNAETYQSIPMWSQVIKNLQDNENFGTSLELQCARHPLTPLKVSQPDHFVVFSPESGCPSLCGETCPATGYCQVCGDDNIKSTCVDFLEMKEYREIDLNEEPCVFPDCGHFLTVSSMDGQMGMAAHYELGMNGVPTTVLGASEPFSGDSGAVKVCPTCRGSLRSISRYGRIVRRVMLDEATKKFVSWSNIEYLKLAQAVVHEQESLIDRILTKAESFSGQPKKQAFIASRLKNLCELQRLAGNGTRYAAMLNLWTDVRTFYRRVQKEEQPFHRVADLVRHANRQNQTKQEFRFDESVIQVKGSLLATALLLKCEIVVFSDFLRLQSEGGLGTLAVDAKIDWSVYIKECTDLIESARKAILPREEVQGHVYAAQFWTFARRSGSMTTGQGNSGSFNATENASDELKGKALEHVNQAKALVSKYPSAVMLSSDIDAAEKMVNDGVFYNQVTKEEMQAVYQAMSREFGGTGHWYRCENNHPFTIGECGMPMELARCPECNAPVGGTHHTAVAGTVRAADIEELGRGVERVRI